MSEKEENLEFIECPECGNKYGFFLHFCPYCGIPNTSKKYEEYWGKFLENNS